MAGLSVLLALIWRRDRVKLPLILTLLIASLLAMVPLLRDIYGDADSLMTMYATFGVNPAGLFMTGPMDAPSFGAFMTVETVLWWGLVIAFINTTLIVRHTRHNEEIGAQELILSGRTHRGTSLVAAMTTALVVNLIIAVGIGGGIQLTNPGWGASESWLYGLAFGAFGLVWAAIASVVAQLVEAGRSANSILATLIGVGFILRGIGDFLGSADASGQHQPAIISSFSPFGWMQATRSLTDPEWWPLVITLLVSVVMFGLALWLLGKRDVGAGILPSRRGRARASALLGKPFGLSLRLQRNIFVGWLVGVLVMVGTIGALVPQMSDVYSDSEQLMTMIEAIGGVGEMFPSFMSAMLAIVSLMIFAYALQGLMRLRGEEVSGHLESILSTRLSKVSWLTQHVMIVVLGGVIMLLVAGSSLAFITNAMSDISLDVWQYSLASLSYLSILLVFVGLYVLLFGLLPRLASVVSWVYFGFVAFASWLGPILQLDESIMRLSVMHHIASPPVEEVAIWPLVITSSLGLVMIIIGMSLWRSRDLGSS